MNDIRNQTEKLIISKTLMVAVDHLWLSHNIFSSDLELSVCFTHSLLTGIFLVGKNSDFYNNFSLYNRIQLYFV